MNRPEQKRYARTKDPIISFPFPRDARCSDCVPCRVVPWEQRNSRSARCKFLIFEISELEGKTFSGKMTWQEFVSHVKVHDFLLHACAPSPRTLMSLQAGEDRWRSAAGSHDHTCASIRCRCRGDEHFHTQFSRVQCGKQQMHITVLTNYACPHLFPLKMQY